MLFQIVKKYTGWILRPLVQCIWFMKNTPLFFFLIYYINFVILSVRAYFSYTSKFQNKKCTLIYSLRSDHTWIFYLHVFVSVYTHIKRDQGDLYNWYKILIMMVVKNASADCYHRNIKLTFPGYFPSMQIQNLVSQCDWVYVH